MYAFIPSPPLVPPRPTPLPPYPLVQVIKERQANTCLSDARVAREMMEKETVEHIVEVETEKKDE